MLNASDYILNQIKCTDSSKEYGENTPTNQKFAHALPENSPPLPSLSRLLPHQRLNPPAQG